MLKQTSELCNKHSKLTNKHSKSRMTKKVENEIENKTVLNLFMREGHPAL